MIEPWLGSFLIGFFGMIIAILILNKAFAWGCLGIIILVLAFLFWGYVDFYPLRSYPADMSPSQSVTGRLGWFLGAASSCIWLDAPKKGKVNALISVSNWGRFMVATAIYLMGMIEFTLIFSSDSLFTGILLASGLGSAEEDDDGFRQFMVGLTLFIATIWIWWHWDTIYATMLYEIDITQSTLSTLGIASLFYGRTGTISDNTTKGLESLCRRK